jgi:3-methyladenine DNA glycosylase AlkC
VDPSFIRQLENGTTESRTHVEQMSMSMSALLGRAFPEVVFDPITIDAIPFISRLRAIGDLLRRTYGSTLIDPEVCWVSDTIRGWLAMAMASDDLANFETTLEALRPFARDHHFAVREWAWLAARPRVVRNPKGALALLETFFSSPDPLERRFAVEATRPRSVWGEHIPLLKAEPELAEAILGRLACDPSPYVRAAVGNWLRDAGRSRPDWTRLVTSRWLDLCKCPATRAIVRRATMNLPAASESIWDLSEANVLS